MPLLYPDLRPLSDVLLQGQGHDPGGYEDSYPQKHAMAGIPSPDISHSLGSSCPLEDTPRFSRLEGLCLFYGQPYHEPPKLLVC